jgi:hypothetical protein
MRGRPVTYVAVFCIACLIVSGGYAKGKPDKPDKPSNTKTEWIAFTGDLIGAQPVDDCCPNAGPFPAYGMELLFAVGDVQPGYHDGQLFINRYGAGRDQKYKVQFWTDDFGIEIIGGVIDDDRKNKILTVTFTNETCVDLYTKVPVAVVSFELVRTPY